MAIPKKILASARESDRALDRMMQLFDRELFEVIQDIERKILAELRVIDLDKGGNIVKNRANLSRTMNARSDENICRKDFEPSEVYELTRALKEFTKEEAKERQGERTDKHPAKFAESTKGNVRDMDLKSGANLVLDGLYKDLMSETLVGGNFNDLVKKIQSRLMSDLLTAGEQIPVGKSLAAEARRIGHDTLQQTYRSIHTKQAKDAGITRYLYFGSTVAGTREFCAERVNKIFTDEEIDSWNDLEWTGRIPGIDVRIALGGFNCRHALVPVPEGIEAADLGIEEEPEGEEANAGS